MMPERPHCRADRINVALTYRLMGNQNFERIFSTFSSLRCLDLGTYTSDRFETVFIGLSECFSMEIDGDSSIS